jgi:Icc-related predicted phosphoesterase
MRILAVSDIHYNLEWLKWIADQAPLYDVIVIAGDALDLKKQENEASFYEQVYHFHGWAKRLTHSLSPYQYLAFASGNNDKLKKTERNDEDYCLLKTFDEKVRELVEKSHRWVELFSNNPQMVSDRQTKNVILKNGQEISLTTFPFVESFILADGQGHENFMIEGGYLNLKKPWIVVHHEPPAGTPLNEHLVRHEVDTLGSICIREFIEDCQPTFSFHGHVHSAPVLNVGSFHAKVGKTHCFNPGQILGGPYPAHIIVDTEKETATWNAPNHVSKQVRLDGFPRQKYTLSQLQVEKIPTLVL